MRAFLPLAILTIICFTTIAQVNFEIIDEHHSERASLIKYKISDPLVISDEHNGFHFLFEAPIEFTSFVIGWITNTDEISAYKFHLDYRVHKPGVGWQKWHREHGYTKPYETATGAYHSHLLFGYDELLHDSIEFVLYNIENVVFEEIQVSLQDVSAIVNTERETNPIGVGSRSCPEFPAMIPRADWCSGDNACLNPGFTPTVISPTHIVVHHGAGSTSYTDGYALIYNYWHWHVHGNSWADIGYNYVFDKYGNFFQGRHNPNLPHVDIRGAHAGAANSASIGINYLGNSDIDNPTTVQNQKASEFMAWWFDFYGFDPLSSADIYCQDLVTRNLPRICGHRDVNPGGTACPGNALYDELPLLRNLTAQIINNCLDPYPPTTEIVVNRSWYSNDFDVNFIDEDNEGGSGVRYSFYQVMDFDGSEWRANADYGFFNDNFSSAIHPEWTDIAGTWSISNGHLLQTNQDLANTNLYAEVEQTEGNVYLYHWQMKISGSGTNRRAGMHFFCSDPEQNNRENSYMVFFRVDSDKVQLYRYDDNTMNLVTDDVTEVNAEQWYDIKIILDTNTGLIMAFKDDQLVSQWTDPDPYTYGNSISLRTANCEVEYDDIKVYIGRAENVKVTVGDDLANMVRYESPDFEQDAARIRTVLIDNANNWSDSYAEHLFIDFTAPETESVVENDWQTEDFLVQFNDTDDLSGIDRRYYQVADFNGENWHANSEYGFYKDNFENLTTAWTSEVGIWQIQDDVLVQTDESEGNTNIHSYLRQDLSNRYLYEFDMKLEGSGENLRAGFHYFCDDPEQSNRGNSYFIWFREATQDLEFYRVEDNIFSLEKHYKIDFEAGEWYNIKLIFDRVTGEKLVYMDNVLVGEWTDPNVWPLLEHENHSYISFRSGNCIMSINNFNVYRTRLPEVTVSIGDENSMIRYQNSDPESSSAVVKSIVTDLAQNLSEISYHNINVDWTEPYPVAYVNDGYGADIDITYNLEEISANWAESTDPHSGIARYFYAVGTSPGATDLIDWTDNGLNTSFINTDITLIEDETYYTSVISENGAGLQSEVTSSDGVLAAVLVEPVEPDCPADFELCLNDEVLVLSGADPDGGIYSGNGVSENVNFNPDIAGIGTHTITYDYYGEICTFEITVKDIPNLVCPEDLIVLNTEEIIILSGALPEGGTYFLNQQEITEFNPTDYSIGDYIVEYHYYDENTNCSNTCNFTITIELDVNKTISESSSINIYPNPNYGNFTIEFNNISGEVQYEIIDNHSRIIKSGKHFSYENSKKQIELNVAKGVYYIKLFNGEFVRIEKIIIK